LPALEYSCFWIPGIWVIAFFISQPEITRRKGDLLNVGISTVHQKCVLSSWFDKLQRVKESSHSCSLYQSGKLDGNEATSTEKLLGFWGGNLWLSHCFLPPFC
jgi:hypothetical protein